MKLFRRIYLITLGVLSLATGIIGATQVHEFWAGVILLSGMIAGALGVWLIALTEANPHGLYMKVSKKSNKQIRIL